MDGGFFAFEPVEYRHHVLWIGDRAVEVGGEIGDPLFQPQTPHGYQPGVVPLQVVAAEFDLQASEPVAVDPVGEQARMAILRFVAGELVGGYRIEPPYQVPGREALERLGAKVIAGILAGKRGVVSQETRQVAGEVGRGKGVVHRGVVEYAVRIVQGDVE